MDGGQPPTGGFDPHVMDQLQNLASGPAPRSRGQSSRKRGKVQYQKFDFEGQQVPSQHRQPHIRGGGPPVFHQANFGHRQPPDPNSFPPLGSVPDPQPIEQYPVQQLLPPRINTHLHGHYQFDEQTQAHSHLPHQGRWHGRGGGRSRGHFQHHAGVEGQPYHGGVDDFRRPQPNRGRLFQPNGAPFLHSVEQQHNFMQRKMEQSDFLDSIANQALEVQISPEEFREKGDFRKTIEVIAKDAILQNNSTPQEFDVDHVELKLYGSLGSGFAVASSDMDLLLTFPHVGDSLDGIDIESRRWIEKALLDAGYGARLLTNTRVPILKVCQKPSADLLQRLRDHRQQWEISTGKASETIIATSQDVTLPPPFLAPANVVEALQRISIEALEVPLPDTAPDSQPNLEFEGDCGIQCDINFTHYVAIANTELLYVYGKCDPRVRQMGLFVKQWAKARNINTPYKGTLSSYGYIMLVLHYLMNIVDPPLIPNLQAIAKEQDALQRKTAIETIEGFDVRFVRHPDQLQHIMSNLRPNHESIGSLLRGFFFYYGYNGGFHWTRDAISIRTRGGQVTKQSKGWTGAKWSESKQNVRLRYLLAIEDPFEIEHNIGRTVGHSGIVAIRDEFRRAWSIISNVQFDQYRKVWIWIREGGDIGDATEFMEPVHNRGDLLRKDHLARKDRMRQMRKEADLKEQALRQSHLTQRDADLQSTASTTDSTVFPAADT